MRNGIKISTKDGRRVVEGIGFHEPRAVNDLRDLVKGSVQKFGDNSGFKFKDKNGNILSKTYIEFDRDIDCLGTALLSLGLKDKHISILSENRYEWGVCYFSIINGTGVAVPLDKYLPKNEVVNLIDRGGVEAIFYSSSFHKMMIDISKENNNIKYYICIDKIEDTDLDDSKFLNISDLIKKGKILIDSGDKAFVEATIDKNKMSILLFTSGTTSMAKGVMLSHANIASNVTGISTIIYAGPGDVHLSLLPLHHTFENTIGLMYMVHSGVCVVYNDGIKHISQNIHEYKVTRLVVVPALLEVVYRKLFEGIKKSGKEKQFLRMVKVSEGLRSIGIDLRRVFFKKIFNQLGPDLKLSVCGGAPLDPEIVDGFDKIGLKVLQGYGLTETSPVVAANNDFVNKCGTIGYPMAGIEVAIDSPDQNGMGEIITRGASVMLGYYENPEATKEVIDEDGWFRTGDLGIIDEDGFIKITGRVKSMIVLTNGKKTFPEEYEIQINNIRGVKDSFVWGNIATDGDVQVCAKVVLDKEKLALDNGAMPTEKEISSMIEGAIKEINKTMPQYKILRYFVLSYEELIKTTTLKIKRPAENEKMKKALDNAGIDMRKASGRFIDTLG